MMFKKRGFATLSIFIGALLGVMVLGGIGYGVYNYQTTAKENEALRLEIETQKNQQSQEAQKQKEELSLPEQVESTTSAVVLEDEPKRIEITKEVVYVNQSPTISPSQRQTEIDAAVKKALAEKEAEQPVVTPPPSLPVQEAPTVIESKDIIKVLGIAQTSYPDDYGGVYGAYKLSIQVTPAGGDILIPPTTSDTLGSRIIGFTYSVNGGEFKGIQNSEVDCGGRMNNGYCKIIEGTSKDLFAQVWIYPNEGSDGNYSVVFKKIKYLLNGVEKEVVINAESEVLNLYY